MYEEYRKREQAFMDRHDALCEDVPPAQCNCSQCPAQGLCKWLHENEPFRKG